MNEKTAVIRELIIPLDRYPHLNERQTLKKAIETIFSFQAGREELLQYGLLLVVNDRNQLVGRLSLMDIMHGLAPKLLEATRVNKFEGKETEYPNLAFLYEDETFATCGSNQSKPIESFMHPLDFSLSADTHILKALVMMSHRNDFNVPVTDNGNVIGILRLEEIFKKMCTTYCNIR